VREGRPRRPVPAPLTVATFVSRCREG
jgi:hypothetical protein